MDANAYRTNTLGERVAAAINIDTVMATYLSGNVRKATPNTVTAMRRSAEARRCPKCGRKSARVFLTDPYAVACRWCDYYSPLAALSRSDADG